MAYMTRSNCIITFARALNFTNRPRNNIRREKNCGLRFEEVKYLWMNFYIKYNHLPFSGFPCMTGARIWKLGFPLSPTGMVISTHERYSQTGKWKKSRSNYSSARSCEQARGFGRCQLWVFAGNFQVSSGESCTLLL